MTQAKLRTVVDPGRLDVIHDQWIICYEKTESCTPHWLGSQHIGRRGIYRSLISTTSATWTSETSCPAHDRRQGREACKMSTSAGYMTNFSAASSSTTLSTCVVLFATKRKNHYRAVKPMSGLNAAPKRSPYSTILSVDRRVARAIIIWKMKGEIFFKFQRWKWEVFYFSNADMATRLPRRANIPLMVLPLGQSRSFVLANGALPPETYHLCNDTSTFLQSGPLVTKATPRLLGQYPNTDRSNCQLLLRRLY